MACYFPRFGKSLNVFMDGLMMLITVFNNFKNVWTLTFMITFSEDIRP